MNLQLWIYRQIYEGQIHEWLATVCCPEDHESNFRSSVHVSTNSQVTGYISAPMYSAGKAWGIMQWKMDIMQTSLLFLFFKKKNDQGCFHMEFSSSLAFKLEYCSRQQPYDIIFLPSTGQVFPSLHALCQTWLTMISLKEHSPSVLDGKVTIPLHLWWQSKQNEESSLCGPSPQCRQVHTYIHMGSRIFVSGILLTAYMHTCT